MQDRITAHNAADWIRDRLPSGFTPKGAIVLGTGLGDVTHALDTVATISLPGYPRLSPLHCGGARRAASRRTAGRAARSGLAGRFHLYEGYSPAQVCQGVRVSALLGATILVVTNAAGALDPLFSAGELLAITDHVNLTGKSPLPGRTSTPGGRVSRI